MAKRKIPSGTAKITGGDIEIADYVLALAVVGIGIVLYKSVGALTLAGSRISDAGTRIADVGTRAAGAGDWFSEGAEYWTQELWQNPVDWIFGERGRGGENRISADAQNFVQQSLQKYERRKAAAGGIAPMDGINPVDNSGEPGTFFHPQPGDVGGPLGYLQNLNAGNRAAAWWQSLGEGEYVRAVGEK